jgi:hypothetical protein
MYILHIRGGTREQRKNPSTTALGMKVTRRRAERITSKKPKKGQENFQQNNCRMQQFREMDEQERILWQNANKYSMQSRKTITKRENEA